MTRAQLVKLVTRLMEGSGTDAEEDADIEALMSAVPHPSPTDFLADTERDWTAEEIVDACLAYSPCELGG